ncbi:MULTISPECIES: N-formylglutamate deformylase [Hyphobacterium]|uniref:N-formylglutamate deformylase n=1 Tax=Hyphobacterium vulgare TaxID=1736751 RepID=A0ABV6ZTI9_9PROT
MSEVFSLRRGQEPLVISIPHSGTDIPDDIAARLGETARSLPDTDWFVDRLYGFAEELDATILCAKYSRYVIDLNRDPSGTSLYPGQATTGLVPVERFDGTPLYRAGAEPDEAEIEHRRSRYFDPYHRAIAEELSRVRTLHGYALLYDAHSIASVVPRLFEGELPVLNLGTNSGTTCAPEIERAAVRTILAQDEYEAVSNGRFKGGWITRSFGRPHTNVHALQMELAQRAYMDEAAKSYDEAKAAMLQPVLKSILEAAVDAAEKLHWEVSK